MEKDSENQRAASADPSKSSFAAFNVNQFIGSSDWHKLKAVLDGNGGTFGIGGPRGSGKSWLILRAVSYAHEIGGIGFWFPAPSDYGAEPLLRALGTSVAAAIRRKLWKVRPRFYERLGSPWIIVGSLLCVWWSLIAMTQSYTEFLYPLIMLLFHFPQTLPEASLLVGVMTTLGSLLGFTVSRRSSKRLFNAAQQLDEHIRYSESLTRRSEASLSAASGVGGLLKLGRERSLVERPLTLAGLVNELRDILELAAEIFNGHVVVGIDELDKIHDPNDARRLLRDLKGIFEIEGVHFLVSVSDEARRTLELGTMRMKDEFNSSFYTVIDTEPRTPVACVELLNLRSNGVFTENGAIALAILSAGNLRELVRLADITRHYDSSDQQPLKADGVVTRVWEFEVAAFQRDLLSSKLEPHAKVWAYRELEQRRKSSLQQRNAGLWLQELWDPPMDMAKNSIWRSEFAEAWHCFLVRTAVSKIIMNQHVDSEFGKLLQRALVMSELAADVGRHILTELQVSEENRSHSKPPRRQASRVGA
jgi:hypothetical protein